MRWRGEYGGEEEECFSIQLWLRVATDEDEEDEEGGDTVGLVDVVVIKGIDVEVVVVILELALVCAVVTDIGERVDVACCARSGR
jgi:hypothetical protein